jgi:hypothetical protein
MNMSFLEKMKGDEKKFALLIIIRLPKSNPKRLKRLLKRMKKEKKE